MAKEFIMKPKVDFCFKELMEDETIRRGFLASILNIRPEEVVKTELLSTHLRKEHADDKLGILDVRVILNDNVQIDMEIQVAPFDLWPERSLFYLAKIYVGQLHEGEDYDKLKKCIHVGILDFELLSDDTEYYSQFHIWEDSRRRKYTDKFEIHIFELPKLKRYEYPETELLNWMLFMNAEKKEEFEMLAGKSEYMEKAYEKLTEISADEQKRLEYEAREKAIRDHNYLMKSNMKAGFQKGYDSGYEKGYDSGYGTGYGSGYDSGYEKGENSILIEQVKKKMQKNKSIAQIADELEQPEDRIKNLIDELKENSEC